MATLYSSSASVQEANPTGCCSAICRAGCAPVHRQEKDPYPQLSPGSNRSLSSLNAVAYSTENSSIEPPYPAYQHRTALALLSCQIRTLSRNTSLLRLNGIRAFDPDSIFMNTPGHASTGMDLVYWQQLKNGNESGLRKLIEKYFNALQNYGYKFLRDEDFVKDCVQEVFIEIWNRRERIIIPDSVRAYLLSSVRKRVLREGFRQRISRDNEPVDLENDLNFVEFSPEWSVIEQESLVETTKRITDSLNLLPKRQREVIYLRYYQNLERDEIAEIMGVNPQSVSNLLQAAFKSFRDNWVGFAIIIHLIRTGSF